jgi:hypothetical protein
MMRIFGMIIIFTVIGLVVGYFIFGHVNGKMLSVGTIFSSNDNFIERTIDNITGVESIRQNILISGVVGAVIGLFLGVLKKRK